MLRSQVPELMDDPRLAPELLIEALRTLELLNRLTGMSEVLWSELKSITPSAGSDVVRVLDIATGSGDILIGLSELARRSGKKFEFVGTDISPTALSHATENARQKNADLSFMKLDALLDEIPEGFDVVTTSLFTHHLAPDEVIALFEKMRASGARLVLVNDLVRSRLSYSLVWIATRLLTTSPVTHFDGPASVNNSYTQEEMRNMALEAGLQDCQIKPHPPCRQLLVWKRA